MTNISTCLLTASIMSVDWPESGTVGNPWFGWRNAGQNNAPGSYKELQAAALDNRNNDFIIIAQRKEFAPLLDKPQSDSDL
jgi:hypothetical protein